MHEFPRSEAAKKLMAAKAELKRWASRGSGWAGAFS
jgi:hypothetical protein